MKGLPFFYIVVICLLMASCQPENFADIFEDIDIKLDKDKNELYADSISSTIIKVDFKRNLPQKQQVTFETSHGALFMMPYRPEGSGSDSLTFAPFSSQAEVLLKAQTLDTVEQVFVSVTINDVTKYTTLSFTPAEPESMLLPPNQPSLKVNENATITADLFGEKGGNVSNGIRFNIRSELEADSTIQEELRWNVPEFVFSNNNSVRIPVEILQHVPGSRLRIFVSYQALEKSTLLFFE